MTIPSIVASAVTTAAGNADVDAVAAGATTCAGAAGAAGGVAVVAGSFAGVVGCPATLFVKTKIIRLSACRPRLPLIWPREI